PATTPTYTLSLHDALPISPHGDAAETAAVKAVFGEQARKLVFGSTKSMTGHLQGAAGALEAAVCALVVQRGTIPPTINQFTPDPDRKSTRLNSSHRTISYA